MSADARVWQLEDTGSLWAGINDWELENPPFEGPLTAVMAHVEQCAGSPMRWVFADNIRGPELKGYK